MPQLDGLRFFAVAGVMAGHWLTYPAMSDAGPILATCGVDLFFVLSGFLITQILIQSKINAEGSSKFILRQFYIRRFLRIFPLYYLVLIVGWLGHVPSGNTNFAWFLTYTTNIVCAIKHGECGYFTHLWSLAVEEQFYIFFPFVVLLIPTKRLCPAFFIMIALGLASRAAACLLFRQVPDQVWVTYVSTPCCLDAFGIGALLAYLKLFDPEALKRSLTRYLPFVTAAVTALGMYFVVTHLERFNLLLRTFYRFGWCIFFFWVIGKGSLSAYNGVARLILENRVIVYLGKISYGLYVYHHFAPYAFARFHFDATQHSLIFNAALYFVASVGVSAASWQIFEKPINELKKYFTYTAAETHYSYGRSKQQIY